MIKSNVVAVNINKLDAVMKFDWLCQSLIHTLVHVGVGEAHKITNASLFLSHMCYYFRLLEAFASARVFIAH